MKSSIKISNGDKATPRPWEFRHIKSGCHVVTVGVIESFGNGQFDIDPVCDMAIPEPTLEKDIELAKANAALIVKAVNEHAALEMVAEAAKEIRDFARSHNEDSGRCNQEFEQAAKAFDDSIANLAAVRKEGK